ncbi:hypothetical protein GCM10009663_67550 [Kitasatospora arboriphila]|uniref:Uncharacterized protein n=1 Tax=Kitasatospora arboriphila TaxID=258052 RepID=A0ABN1U4D3_9ACTN
MAVSSAAKGGSMRSVVMPDILRQRRERLPPIIGRVAPGTRSVARRRAAAPAGPPAELPRGSARGGRPAGAEQ